MDASSMKYIAVAAMSVAMCGAALGVSNIFSSALNGIARNPDAEAKISKYVYVGAGLCEAMGLFALVIAFLIMFS